MGGPGYVVQIYESLFQGKQKYNRGRLLKSDKKPRENIADRLRSMINGKKTKRNYGDRVQGPWVFWRMHFITMPMPVLSPDSEKRRVKCIFYVNFKLTLIKLIELSIF